MVVLTIVAPSNGYTVYFDQPIPKPNYARLLSCSLYNSWHNLKRSGQMSLFDSQDNATVRTLPPGHYTLESMAKEIENIFAKDKVELGTEINTPVGSMVIYNLDMRKIYLDCDLSRLLGINRQLLFITYVMRLTSPSTFFIHCDLVDKEQNLLNGKPSSVLARFDIRGKAYEKVHYQTAPQHVLRDASSDKYVNSVTLSVKDENGELF